jgi:adenylylsulfate kinase-like enzyme
MSRHLRHARHVEPRRSSPRMIPVVTETSPYQSIRDENRKLVGRFVEIYCKAPLETLIDRDPKGLYKKAIAGEIKGFTGIDDPYEEPPKPEVVVNTAEETVEESVNKIIRTLELMGYVPVGEAEQEYSEEEEEEIKKRLSDLGYI